jgi:hypothetical protein
MSRPPARREDRFGPRHRCRANPRGVRRRFQQIVEQGFVIRPRQVAGQGGPQPGQQRLIGLMPVADFFQHQRAEQDFSPRIFRSFLLDEPGL